MRLESVERALIELSSALERPFRSEALYPHVVVALGLRSRSLFRGFIHCLEGPAPIAALPLLRTLVEINILLRFLAEAPEVRAGLWLAEHHRWSLAFIDQIRSSEYLRGRFEEDLPDEGDLELSHEEVRRARQAALGAGLPGIGEKGRLLPSIATQVDLLNDDAALEAYVFAYRRFSSDVHGGIVSFRQLIVHEQEGGGVALSDEISGHDLQLTHKLGATTFASTLWLVSNAIDLNIAEAADSLRKVLMDPSHGQSTDESPPSATPLS